MSYVILDLEWNGSYSKVLHKFVNEIIEIGAVKLDDELNVCDTFTMLVAPKIGKKLCSKVKQLTKITNEELKDEGVSFIKAISLFSDFLGDGVLMTWSDSDLHALIENYSYYTGRTRLPFLSRYCNLQSYCEDCLDLHDSSCQLGLGACAEMAGVDFSEDDQHRALADVYLTLECMKAFYGKYPLKPYIKDAVCDEFYDRLLFKNHFVTDINSPDVDKSVMFFDCEECGKPLVQLSKWRLHNKSFTAEFSCKYCRKKFNGRVSFKKKFDEVSVKKKLNEKKVEKKPETKEQVNTVSAN